MAIFDYDPKAVGMLPYWKWNRVLPAVYDDSLSQYEILCKLLYKVNDIITNSNSMGEQVEQLTQLVQQLIDGQFPSGIVDYVNDIVEAAMAEDIEAMYAAIAAMQNTMNKRIDGITVDTGTMQAIWEVVKSYLHNRDKIVYHTHDPENNGQHNAWDYDTGPWFTTDAFNQSGYAINCSTFVHLVLTGTLYEDSMYNRENGNINYFGGGGYCFNMYNTAVTAGNFELYQNSYDMAPRLRELGLTENIASDFSNIRTGDVLIFSHPTDQTLTPSIDNATHVGIIMGGPYGMYVNDSTQGLYLLAECSETEDVIRVAPITSRSLVQRGVVATAHIPYQAVPIRNNNLLFSADIVRGHASIIPDNMVVGDIITIDCDFITENTAQYMDIRINDAAVNSSNPLKFYTTPRNSSCVGKQHVVMTLSTMCPTIENGTVISEIGIYARESSTIENIKVYEGYGNIGYIMLKEIDSTTDIQSFLGMKTNEFSTGYHVNNIHQEFIHTDSMTVGNDTIVAGEMILDGVMKVRYTNNVLYSSFDGTLHTPTYSYTVEYDNTGGTETFSISR